MGTWGTRTFETEIALDWLTSLREASDPVAFLRATLTSPQRRSVAPGLTARAAEHILCAGQIIAGVLGRRADALNVDATRWISAHDELAVAPLAPLAVEAVKQ